MMPTSAAVDIPAGESVVGVACNTGAMIGRSEI